MLITGAAAGIGAGVALRFAEADYAVAALDINGEGATRTIANISSVHAFGSHRTALPTDATKAGILGLTWTRALDHSAGPRQG